MAELTIILATHNGERALDATLRGYTRQENVGFVWKIIIVDNASRRETCDTIARYQERLPLQCLEEPVAGKNRSLNRGLSAIEGNIVIITDDDAVPQPGFLTAWQQAF